MPTAQQDLLTRREVLVGLTAAAVSSAVPAVLIAEPAAPSLCFTSAVEMAALIRAKKLSAREALAEHLKQIERVNPKVNAIVTLIADHATAAAARADEMHGLPVAHKDLIETAGVRTTFGSPLFKDYVPTHDNLLVTRMRAAGPSFSAKPTSPSSAPARRPSTVSSAQRATPMT
jgi:amidase